jgi:hypothetical protein
MPFECSMNNHQSQEAIQATTSGGLCSVASSIPPIEEATERKPYGLRIF